MTGNTYYLSIENNSQGETVALAYGDLAEVNFIGRKRLPEIASSADDFTVVLVETESIGRMDDEGNPLDVRREVTQFSGKGKRAAMVLKAELADERKQAADSEGDQAADSGEQQPEQAEQL